MRTQHESGLRIFILSVLAFLNPNHIAYSSGHTPFRAYVKIFCFLSAGVLVSILSLNYVLDPYLIHQWDSSLIQRLQPAREKLSPWGKAYAVAKYKPTVIYLGNSRTEVGLPTDTDIFGRKKVFNSALSGASISDAIAMANHAAALNRLDTVVWGIDYMSFSTAGGNPELDRELVAGTGNYFFHRAVMDIKRAISWDMTRDSVKVLLGSFGSVCRSNLAFNGQRDDVCMEHGIQTQGGTKKAIESIIREFGTRNPSENAIQEFKYFINKLCNTRTQVRLYINPTHALMTEALFLMGKWDSMEMWQSSMAKIADDERQSGCDIRLFDFSGFNSITVEAIPKISGQEKMEHYWEISHYRNNVGSMVLKRMFATDIDSVPHDFGIELTSVKLPEYFKKARLSRDQYHHDHGVETEFVKGLVLKSSRKDNH